jgi:hypothetical protein
MVSVLQLQLMNSIYTTESVPALQNIRHHLDQRIEELKHSYEETTQRLEKYRQLGQGFEILVQTYTHLLKRIEEKRWALQQLQHVHNDEKTHSSDDSLPIVTSSKSNDQI